MANSVASKDETLTGPVERERISVQNEGAEPDSDESTPDRKRRMNIARVFKRNKTENAVAENTTSVGDDVATANSVPTGGTITAAIRAPKRRDAPSYNVLEEGAKGDLRIPGVFKGSETVVKGEGEDPQSLIVRDRQVLGGLAKRQEGYETVKDDDGALQGLVRTFKTQSNPLRSRRVEYSALEQSGETVTAGMRTMDVRFAGTKIGYTFNETEKGRQYTQIQAVAYSRDIKDNDDSSKRAKNIQQKESSLLGVIKRRYDLVDGEEVQTGRQNLLASKYTEQKSNTIGETTVRIRGLMSKTYLKPLIAEKSDNSERFTSERNFGTFHMKATQATATSPAVKEQKLGKYGTFFKRTETIPSEGDEKTVNFKILGISANRTVKLTEEEKTLRARQLPPPERPDAPPPQGIGASLTRGVTVVRDIAKENLQRGKEQPIQTVSDVANNISRYTPAPFNIVPDAVAKGAGEIARRNRDKDEMRKSEADATAASKAAASPKNRPPVNTIEDWLKAGSQPITQNSNKTELARNQALGNDGTKSGYLQRVKEFSNAAYDAGSQAYVAAREKVATWQSGSKEPQADRPDVAGGGAGKRVREFSNAAYDAGSQAYVAAREKVASWQTGSKEPHADRPDVAGGGAENRLESVGIPNSAAMPNPPTQDEPKRSNSMWARVGQFWRQDTVNVDQGSKQLAPHIVIQQKPLDNKRQDIFDRPPPQKIPHVITL